MHNKNNQHGFSLIEVLVAVLILAIGMLGIAGLQAVAKRTNYEAMQRTTATMLAQDIVERMRANPGEIDSYLGTITPGSATETICGGGTANCNPAQLAAYDLYEWDRAISGVAERRAGGEFSGGLVSPVGCITQAADGSVRIAIAWRGLTALSNPTIDTCGEGTAAYHDTGTDNAYRRVMFIETVITE